MNGRMKGRFDCRETSGYVFAQGAAGNKTRMADKQRVDHDNCNVECMRSRTTVLCYIQNFLHSFSVRSKEVQQLDWFDRPRI